MHLEFQTNFRDFAAAQTLHAKRSEIAYLSHCVARYFFPVLGVLILLFEFTPHLVRASAPKVFSAACGLFLVCTPAYIHVTWKRAYKRTRSGNGNLALDFSEELIRCKGEHSKSEIEWSAIQSFSEDESLFLLYLAPARFLPIPKRICTAKQIDELRLLFKRQIKLASESLEAR